jgi:hypothetical protein
MAEELMCRPDRCRQRLHDDFTAAKISSPLGRGIETEVAIAPLERFVEDNSLSTRVRMFDEGVLTVDGTDRYC